ncbi:MAG: histidinol-phosphate transaminase [Lachnospiraceae bacterium]|nr:histidinol-phosphate transaminase [Lachnospiraceae bacterium]
MSVFFAERNKTLEPYTPGEQPREQKYIKLNTNESPFEPAHLVKEYVACAGEQLQLYSDPTLGPLVKEAAEYYKVNENELIFTNGSDEILNFAVMAFAEELRFPDITYGFYPVYANLYHLPYKEVPVKDDFTIDVENYFGNDGMIILANPNAITGIALTVEDIRKVLEQNPNHVVLVDEAYVDFGGESCVPLIKEYNNLLVAQTFSKSRSMAGARLGVGIGNKKLIEDLNTIKFSTNPYNVNTMTMWAGIGALREQEYFEKNCRVISENRSWLKEQLEKRNFTLTPSKANFVLAKSDAIQGMVLYEKLKEKGILVRHFGKKRIKDYIRITIGSKEQMRCLVTAIDEILGERT